MTNKQIDWLPHYCETGSDITSNLLSCISKSKEYKMRIIFVFNYVDIFEVLPSGKWTSKRIKGGMPVIGPSSEFIPKEGWSKFFGH